MKPPVRGKELRAAYTYGLGFITVVVIGLFVQKGSNASVFWTTQWMALAAAGCLMVNTAVVGVLTRGRPHHHKLHRVMEKPSSYLTVGILGVALVLISFIAIDNSPSNVIPPSSRGQENVDTSVSLRDPQHAQNDQSFRFLVTIFNRTPSTVLLNQAEFSITRSETGNCSDRGNVYRLAQTIKVKDGELKDVQIEALEGPFEGYSVEAHGTLDDLCQEKAITIIFPVTISLAPAESTYLALDVPRQLSVVEESGRALGAPEVHDFPVTADDPCAAFSARVRDDRDAWASISVNRKNQDASNECGSSMPRAP
jgi:hypothetical protein